MDNRQNPAFYQQQRNSNIQPLSQLKNISFDISDIYFPMFVLQMRYEIFALRNRQQRNNNLYRGGNNDYQQNNAQQDTLQFYDQIDDGDDDALYHEYQRQYYEYYCTNNKIINQFFFILRDQYLVTKVQITGTIVFQIRKEERYFFGLDDSTGVMTCVLWLNGQEGNEKRQWLADHNIGIGSVVSLLGHFDYYKDKMQVSVHRLRSITDINEEMLAYQQTIMAQKCYFDPFKKFQRKLFKQQPEQQQEQPPEPIPQQQQEPVPQQEEIYKFSIKRIKKKINDFILNNYHDLFFKQTNGNKSDTSAENVSPIQDRINIPLEYQQMTLTEQDIIQNGKLLGKIKEELKLSEDESYDPVKLLKECLTELEEKGFLNLVGNTVNQYMVQIRDQKQKLKHFISDYLKSGGSHLNNRSNQNNGRGVSLDTIYRAVCQQYDNFYTKEFVFKVIDDLSQMGIIYETNRCVYAYLDNQL